MSGRSNSRTKTSHAKRPDHRSGLFALMVLAVCFIAMGCNSLPKDSYESKIDSIFLVYSRNKPGGQLAVSRDGRVVYSKAWGMADLENEVPLTTESLIEAGSVSKQFTAAAILLLEQQGKLKLDDPVTKYLPALPSYGPSILLRHLIHHTSGLREWSDIAEFGGSPESLRVMDNEKVLEIVCRQKSLNSSPGTEFRYSNSNYILLALIVEKVSGSSFADFTEWHIFKPAGMTHTRWRNDYAQVVPKRSQAYEIKDGIFRLLMPENNVHGAGGLLTTAEDLLKWNLFYSNEKLGGKMLKDKQTAPDTLENGEINNYAAGLYIEYNNPKPMFHHRGATQGYRAELINCPTLGLSVAWLSNTSMLDTIGFDPAMEVLKIFARPEDIAPLPRKKRAPVKIDPNTLQSYVGLYKSAQSSRDVDITLGADGLILSENKLEPVDERRFRFFDILLSFDQQGGLTVTPPSGASMPYHITDTTAHNTPLDQYAGTFFSDEVAAPIEIRKTTTGLEARLISGVSHPLAGYFKDRFFIPDIKTELVFKRNGSGVIDAFELNTARTLHLRFGK
jgi:CubicO group peptidase (beta-lactamase class C family)